MDGTLDGKYYTYARVVGICENAELRNYYMSHLKGKSLREMRIRDLQIYLYLTQGHYEHYYRRNEPFFSNKSCLELYRERLISMLTHWFFED